MATTSNDGDPVDPVTEHVGIQVTFRRGKHLVGGDYMSSCSGVALRLDTREVIERASANGDTDAEAEGILRENLAAAARRWEAERS